MNVIKTHSCLTEDPPTLYSSSSQNIDINSQNNKRPPHSSLATTSACDHTTLFSIVSLTHSNMPANLDFSVGNKSVGNNKLVNGLMTEAEVVTFTHSVLFVHVASGLTFSVHPGSAASEAPVNF